MRGIRASIVIAEGGSPGFATMAVKKTKTDENDFEALDRLARSIMPDKLQPLTSQQQERWESAKRGRPKKPPGAKAVPTLITVEPQLLRRADAYAKRPA